MNREKLLKLFRQVLRTRPDLDNMRQAQNIVEAMDLLLDIAPEMEKKLLRVISRSLQKAPDRDSESRAQRLVDAVELMLAMEADTEPEPIELNLDLKGRGAKALPQSPGVQESTDSDAALVFQEQEPKSRLIILPGDPDPARVNAKLLAPAGTDR